MFILMPVPHCFGYASFVVPFEIRMCESSNFVLLYFFVAIQGMLQFHIKLRIRFPFLQKRLLKFCLEFIDHFELQQYIVVLMILNRSVH